MAPGINQYISSDSAFEYLTSAMLEPTKPGVCPIRLSISVDRIDQELAANSSISAKTKLANSHPEFLRAGMKFLTLERSRAEHYAMMDHMLEACRCDFRQADMKDLHTFRQKPANALIPIFEVVTIVSNLLIFALSDLTQHRFRNPNATGVPNWPQGPDDLFPYGLKSALNGLIYWGLIPPHGCIIFRLTGSLALFYTPFSQELLHSKSNSNFFHLPFLHLQEAVTFYHKGGSSPLARAQFFTYPVKTIIDYFNTLMISDTPQFNLAIIARGRLFSPVLTQLSEVLSTMPEEWKYRSTVNFMLEFATAQIDPMTGLAHMTIKHANMTKLIEMFDPLEEAFKQLTVARKMGCLNIACPSAYMAIPSRLCTKCDLVRFCGEKCLKEAWKSTTFPHKALCAKVYSLREFLGHENWSFLWSLDFTYAGFRSMCQGKNVDVENVKAIGSTLNALKKAQGMYREDLARAGASPIERLYMARQQKAMAETSNDLLNRYGRKLSIVERKDSLALLSGGAIHG